MIQPAQQGHINVTFGSIHRASFTIDLNRTVAQLKTLFYVNFPYGSTINDFTVLFAGRPLDDRRTLSSYRIADGDSLQVHESPRVQGKFRVCRKC
jgi:hypothetical protein